MTMARAVIFLVASGLIMAAGIVLLVARVNSGLVDSSISSRSAGARVGDNPATPDGAGGVSSGAVGATVTAAVRTATALSSTARTVVPSPAVNVTPVAVGQPIEVNGSRYTVHRIADPEPPGTFVTTAGSRRVALEVSQEALTANVTYSFANFRLRDVNGKEYTWAITNTSPKFESGTLRPGESKRGWISFQLPVGVAAEALVVQVAGQSKGAAIVSLK